MKTEFVNFDDLYDPKRVITNYNPLDKDKKFSPDGVFSEVLFGKKNDSEMISYQCECGKYKGKFLLGKTCEECGTVVDYKSSNLDKLAWINLDKYYVINPIFYYLISRLTGGSQKLNRIINYDKKIEKNGNVIEEEKSEFDNIGLVEFKENFFQGKNILKKLYIDSKCKDKDEVYKLLLREKDKIFVNHIPVYDIQLRPATIVFNSEKPIFRFDEINNSYNFIIQFSNIINKENKDFKLVVLPNLYNIQCKYNIIFGKIIENLAGKTGFIRSNLLGSRVNYSSRCVITPLPKGYDICDVILPYIPFVELYSFQLINMLSSIKHISLIEAQKIVFDAQANFNEEVYDLCMELVNKSTHGGLLMLGIRNPTIARGSILCHRIAGVKHDITDLTASLHNSILQLIAGDYDGDVYNIFPIFDNDLKDLFYHTFSPDVMFVSNNTGRFNDKLSLDRDQVLGIYQFNS